MMDIPYFNFPVLAKHEIRDVVKHCTYRPGYHLSISHITEEEIHIDLLAERVANAYKPGEYLPIMYSTVIHRYYARTAEDLLLHLRRIVLERYELHEVKEWFMYKGQRVSTVHGEVGVLGEHATPD